MKRSAQAAFQGVSLSFFVCLAFRFEKDVVRALVVFLGASSGTSLAADPILHI